MPKNEFPWSIKWRILVTVISGVNLLSLIIYYLAFINTGFSLFQNLAAVIISFLIFGGLMTLLWIPWSDSTMKDWMMLNKKFK